MARSTLTFIIGMALLAACNASNLVRMDVKTADQPDAQMNFGDVDVEIQNVNGDSCFISELDSPGNDFQQGEIDIYEGSDLEGCENFYAPFATVETVTLTHNGGDAWINEYIRLNFHDGSTAYCPNGQQIDDNEVVTIYCNPE